MKRIISTTALSSFLIAGIFVGGIAYGQSSTLKPVSDWDVNQIGQNAQSYCALSRSYDQGVVLTLGQSVQQEYSLAVDFQDSSLNVGESYKVALQPGNGQARVYQLRPASQRALVVRLGFGDDFFEAINSSKQLKAQINSQDYNFDLTDFSAGKSALDSCVAKLNAGAPVKVADLPTIPKATKIVPTLPKSTFIEPVVSPQSIVDVTPVQAINETRQEFGVIETPPPVIVKRAASVPAPRVEKAEVIAIQPEVKVAAVEAPKKAVPVKDIIELPVNNVKSLMPRASVSKSVRVAEVKDGGVIEPAILRERPEIPKISSPVTVKKVVEEVAPKAEPKITPEAVVKAVPKPELLASKVITPVQPIVTPEPIVQKAKEKVEPVKIEIAKPKLVKAEPVKAEPVKVAQAEPQKRVSKRLSDITSDAPKTFAQVRPSPWVSTLQKKQKDELARIKEENKRLNDALQVQVKQPQAPKVTAVAPQKNTAELKALRAQVQKLEAELQAKPDVSAQPFATPEMTKEIELLRAENKKLVSSLGAQEKRMDAFDVKSPKAEKELEKMRAEIAALKSNNERLTQEKSKANSQIDGARVDAGNRAFEKINLVEAQLETAKQDNLKLSREIAAIRAQKDISKTKSDSSDWDLEKATHRYNEAEREIRRLGLLLEQQRTGHRQEKIELEQMLFDPAVTDKQQRRRLVELEAKLLAAERQLEASGRARPQDRYDGSLARLNVAAPQQNTLARAVAAPAPTVVREPVAPVRRPSVLTPEKQNIIKEIVPKGYQAQAKPVLRQPIQPPPVAPRVVAQPAPVPTPQPSVDFRSLLRQAGVQSSSVSQAGNGQYRWQAGSVTGLGHVQPRRSVGSVDQFAQQYIAKVKQSCKGDFASSEALRTNAQHRKYDIVCVDGRGNAASSVVFAEKDQQLVAVSHSANADNLDTVIDLRDRIADKL